MYKKNSIKSDMQLNSSIRKSLEELHQKMDILKENINCLMEESKAIKRQYSLILEVLGENTIAVKNAFRHPAQKYGKMFPIKSLEEFKKFEDSVDETNEKEISATVRALIGSRGIKKGLHDLINPEILVKFNIDGNHNKLRLLNYPKFINILFTASYTENGETKSFKDDLRAALKLVKNRYFKEKSLQKKKVFQKTEQVCENEFQQKVNSLLSNL